MPNHKSLLLIALIVSLSGATINAAPIVRLELLIDGNQGLRYAPKWVEFVEKVGNYNVRVRSKKPGEKPEVRQTGSKTSPIYTVIGFITEREVVLHAAKFRLGDVDGLKKYLERLKGDGVKSLTEEIGLFDLTREQIVDVHKKLSQPIVFATRGRPVGQILFDLADLVKMEFAIDGSVSFVAKSGEKFQHEMKGLSAGTVFAAVLRTHGVALVPEKPPGKPTLLRLASLSETEDFWPVGWPSKARPADLAPDLFKNLTVEIKDTELHKVINAISPRLKTPVLVDERAMLATGVDLNKKVTVPPGRSYYKRILDTALAMGGLRCAILEDDSGRGFLWITTAKPYP